MKQYVTQTLFSWKWDTNVQFFSFTLDDIVGKVTILARVMQINFPKIAEHTIQVLRINYNILHFTLQV